MAVTNTPPSENSLLHQAIQPASGGPRLGSSSASRSLLQPQRGSQAVEEANCAQQGLHTLGNWILSCCCLMAARFRVERLRTRLECIAARSDSHALARSAGLGAAYTPAPRSNSNSIQLPHLRPPRSPPGWAVPCPDHSPSPSLSSFTSDSDSDTPPPTASPHTPACRCPGSPSSQSNTSFHGSQSPHTSPSCRFSSSSSFQSFLPSDEPFFPPFTPSSQPHTCRSWNKSPVSTIASRPWIKNVPYKRVFSQSAVHSLSPSRLPLVLPLPLNSQKTRRRRQSMRTFQSRLAQNRQRTHDIYWQIASCVFVLLVLMSNLVYFLGHLQSRLSRHTPARGDSLAVQMVVEAPERDYLMIYRIIGNDLPPRHSPHQTLTNIKFLLEHEDDFQSLPSLIPPEYSGPQKSFNFDKGGHGQQQQQKTGLKVRKYYILNRIANQTQLEQVSDLLLSSGVPADRILTIPFEMAEYEKRGLRSTRLLGAHASGAGHETGDLETGLEASEQGGDLISADEKRNWAMDRLRALDSVYHEKNLYAMNNNGGRNFALGHGRAQEDARWVLALDGNCFLTPAALRHLINRLADQEAESVKTRIRPASHVIIPMSRLLDNHKVLANNTIEATGDRDMMPMSVEEPQIGFRFSSGERYSNRMRYGRRSKIELLWRLGAIQRNRARVTRSIPDREPEERELITEASYGSIKRPVNDSEQPDFIRAGWVHRLFSGDDRRQEEPTEMAISRRSINRIKGIVWFLEALDQRRLLTPSAGGHPKLFNLDFGKLVELRKSGSSRSHAFKQHVEALAASIARSLAVNYQPIQVFVLALADELSQHARYRSKTLEMIRSSLLNSHPSSLSLSRPSSLSIDPIGYYFPPEPSNPRRSRDLPSTSLLPSALVQPDSTFYLDAVSLLFLNHSATGESLTTAETDQLLKIFSAQTHHLIHLQPSPSDHPLQIDLNLAALASFTRNTRLLNRVLTRSHLRTACDDRPKPIQLDLAIGLRNIGVAPDLIPCCREVPQEDRSILSSTTHLSQVLGLVPD